jgi:HAMP domain-containing protein
MNSGSGLVRQKNKFIVTLLMPGAAGLMLMLTLCGRQSVPQWRTAPVEKGDLNARSNLISNDEIGVLSQSFDKMAQEIEKKILQMYMDKFGISEAKLAPIIEAISIKNNFSIFA